MFVLQVERRKWRAEQKELLDEQLPKATGRWFSSWPGIAEGADHFSTHLRHIKQISCKPDLTAAMHVTPCVLPDLQLLVMHYLPCTLTHTLTRTRCAILLTLAQEHMTHQHSSFSCTCTGWEVFCELNILEATLSSGQQCKPRQYKKFIKQIAFTCWVAITDFVAFPASCWNFWTGYHNKRSETNQLLCLSL